MSIRVRRTAVAVFALTLSLNAASLFAAPRERTLRDGSPSYIQQIIRRFNKFLKPLGLFTNDEDNNGPYPGPPKP